MATTLYTEVENFMKNPIIVWFKSCMELIDVMPGEQVTYDSLLDGVLIHQVYRRTNVTIIDDDIEPPIDDATLRLENFEKIVKNLRHYYEIENNYIIMKMPDVNRLSKQPDTSTEQLEILLHMLLGCAVLGPSSELFIDSIRRLEMDEQELIASCIQRIIKSSTYVISTDMLNATDDLQRRNVQKTLDFIRELKTERDILMDLLRKHTVLLAPEEKGDFDIEDIQQTLASIAKSSEAANAKLHDELHRSKDRERKLRLRLDETGDKVYKLENELQELNDKYSTLQKEKREIELEASLVKTYRDRVDELMEEAAKNDRLERDINRYKRRLENLSDCKSRMDKLLEDNRLLTQKLHASNERHNKYRSQAENTIRDLEQSMDELEKSRNELDELNRSIRCQNVELREENEKLEHASKMNASMNNTRDEDTFMPISESEFSFNLSISDELAECSQTTKITRIQLEIQRLERITDTLLTNSSGSIACVEVEENRKELASILDRMKRYSEGCSTYRSQEPELYDPPDRQKIVQESMRLRALHLKIRLEQKKLQDLLGNVKGAEFQYNGRNARLASELKAAEAKIADLNSYIQNQEFVRKDLQTTKKELADLTADFSQLYREREKLFRNYTGLKGQYDAVRLANRAQKSELENRDRDLLRCESQIDRLTERCENYSRNLVELMQEKRLLMESNDKMRRQNQEFVLQWMKDFQKLQEEICDNASKMQQLHRAKERLEEKIMDQYKHNSLPRSEIGKKKKGVTSAAESLVRRTVGQLRRSSELFRRRRASDIEPSTTFEYARGDRLGKRYRTHLPTMDAHDDRSSSFVNSTAFFENLNRNDRNGDIDDAPDVLGDLPPTGRREINFPFGRRSGVYLDRASSAFTEYFGPGNDEFWNENEATNDDLVVNYSKADTVVVEDEADRRKSSALFSCNSARRKLLSDRSSTDI